MNHAHTAFITLTFSVASLLSAGPGPAESPDISHPRPTAPQQTVQTATTDEDILLDSVAFAPSPYSLSRHVSATIRYQLNDDADLDIRIYTQAGELVRSWSFTAGDLIGQGGSLIWTGDNNKGQRVAFGGYLLKILATPPHGGSRQSATIKIGVWP